MVPTSPEVTTKILYDQDYVIADSKHPRWINWEFHLKRLRFRMKSNDMHFEADFSSAAPPSNLSFAIETFSYTRGHEVDCRTSQLSKLIDSCSGNVIVRNLTVIEKKQLQDLKDEQKSKFTFLNLNLSCSNQVFFFFSSATKNKFKIVYSQDEMRIQSFKTSEIDVTAKQTLEEFSFDVDAYRYQNRRSMWLVDPKLQEESFIIEGLPDETKNMDCYGTHQRLNPV